ncbi:MAG: 30S ribosomal protein S15 [Candidatus Zixiibacteriota bacterium]
MLMASEKAEIMKKFGKNENDTGSAEVQIALLTTRINQLMAHFKNNKKDNNSRRGFFKMIGQRKRLLRYLKKEDLERYQWVIKELGIRK